MTQADLRDLFMKASKSVWMSAVMVSSDPLSRAPTISLAMKATENTEKDPDGPESADEGDILMEYCCD